LKIISFILIPILVLQIFFANNIDYVVNKTNLDIKKECKRSCCKEDKSERVKKAEKKGCCNEKCKCHHLNYNHVALLNSIFLRYDCSLQVISDRCQKSGKRNLHNYDYLNNLINPPRIV
jgi:hypothetical protein